MYKDDQVTVYEFGSGFILFQVAQFESEIDGALIGEDIEYVHRMRVASRRLRTALGLFKDYFPNDLAEKWRSEMRGITKALGNARDLDIQIQLIEEKIHGVLNESWKPGYDRLLLRLKQARAKAQQKVVSAVHTLKDAQTLDEMRDRIKLTIFSGELLYRPELYSAGQEAINNALDSFLGYEEFAYDPENNEKLHAMRIAGKHFRYTMEIFNSIYQDDLDPYIEKMKTIQDQLGEIHDCDVWIAWLPEFVQQEEDRIRAYYGHTQHLTRLLQGIQHLIEDRKQNRQSEYQAFLDNWQMLGRDQTWDSLRKMISPAKDQ